MDLAASIAFINLFSVLQLLANSVRMISANLDTFYNYDSLGSENSGWLLVSIDKPLSHGTLHWIHLNFRQFLNDQFEYDMYGESPSLVRTQGCQKDDSLDKSQDFQNCTEFGLFDPFEFKWMLVFRTTNRRVVSDREGEITQCSPSKLAAP